MQCLENSQNLIMFNEFATSNDSNGGEWNVVSAIKKAVCTSLIYKSLIECAFSKAFQEEVAKHWIAICNMWWWWNLQTVEQII